MRVGKPMIAAINGPLAGIGLCFALYCDLRLMADNAKLTTAFARRGLIAEHGISWLLPRLVGPMHALDLLLSARTVAAAEAAQMGLADGRCIASTRMALKTSPLRRAVPGRRPRDGAASSRPLA